MTNCDPPSPVMGAGLPKPLSSNARLEAGHLGCRSPLLGRRFLRGFKDVPTDGNYFVAARLIRAPPRRPPSPQKSCAWGALVMRKEKPR